MKTTTIKRNGKSIILTIVKYQGRNTLADGNDGKIYIRTGHGLWREAEMS